MAYNPIYAYPARATIRLHDGTEMDSIIATKLFYDICEAYNKCAEEIVTLTEISKEFDREQLEGRDEIILMLLFDEQSYLHSCKKENFDELKTRDLIAIRALSAEEEVKYNPDNDNHDRWVFAVPLSTAQIMRNMFVVGKNSNGTAFVYPRLPSPEIDKLQIVTSHILRG